MRKKVCIEVGHGGKDSGAVSGAFVEKDINLEVSLELNRQLTRHGVDVLISRLTDKNDPAAAFFKKAAEYKPDAGVSIHANAGGGNGFEAFHQTGLMQSESMELSRIIADEVAAAGQALRNPPVRNNETHPTPSADRFTALMNTIPAPYAYCELGFIDNPADIARFDTPEKQRAFGAAYSRAILMYLGISWTDEPDVKVPATVTPTVPKQTTSFTPYNVKVTANILRIRSTPLECKNGTNDTKYRIIEGGIATVLEEASGEGSRRWGRIDKGWIALDFTVRI